MAKTARERLARLLGDSEPAESFSAQLLAPAHVLQLEVSGVGPVSLPVRAPLAKKLIAVARSAMLGRGEQTLTDTGVRDTWEQELTFVAFYADCRHQVTPVRSGYRVTLTFNLLASTETPAPEASPVTTRSGSPR